MDFIFGREAQAYFEGNVIASKGAGCVTASGRESNDSAICKSPALTYTSSLVVLRSNWNSF